MFLKFDSKLFRKKYFARSMYLRWRDFIIKRRKEKLWDLERRKLVRKVLISKLGSLYFMSTKLIIKPEVKDQKVQFIIYKLNIFRRKNLKNQKIWRSPLTTTNLTLSLRLEEEQ